MIFHCINSLRLQSWQIHTPVPLRYLNFRWHSKDMQMPPLMGKRNTRDQQPSSYCSRHPKPYNCEAKENFIICISDLKIGSYVILRGRITTKNKINHIMYYFMSCFLLFHNSSDNTLRSSSWHTMACLETNICYFFWFLSFSWISWCHFIWINLNNFMSIVGKVLVQV